MSSYIMNKIQLITTGGTIDSYYHIDDCTVYPLESSAIIEYLEKYIGLGSKRISHVPLCMKDSREVNEIDIKNISKSIVDSEEKYHVVTHGTFTLCENARKVKKQLDGDDENVVIFTGSMWPLTGFTTNDAAFNLGAAITACELLSPGVYVSFYGKIYGADDIKCLHS